jgi:predicted nucleic-acid-binding Zn-ribbon protein
MPLESTECEGMNAGTMICTKCRAGQMQEYQKTISRGGKESTIFGRKCDRCGYIELDSDDDIWSVVGL